MEVPILESRQALRVDLWAQALQHGLADDFSALVDGDLNNFVPGRCGELPGVDHRVESRDGERRANFIAVELTAAQGSVGKTSLRAVSKRGERLGFRLVLLFGASDWRLRCRQFRLLRESVPGQFLSETLMPVTLSGEIGGATSAVVWVFT
jgi:hypothetical protein